MTLTSPSQRQKLDIESQEDRQDRLSKLLSSVSSSNPASPSRQNPEISLPPFLASSKPHYIPPSDALARAKAFLPLLQSSNTALLKRAARDPSSIDIENTHGDERVIAMDLNLGVYDVRGEAGEGLGPVLDIPEGSMTNGSQDDQDEDGDEEDEEDDDVDDDEDASDRDMEDDDEDEDEEDSSDSEDEDDETHSLDNQAIQVDTTPQLRAGKLSKTISSI